MKTATYPALGSKVHYIKQNPQTGAVETGYAIVEAICLDHTKRPMAHLSKPSVGTDAPHDRFNVDLGSLDRDAEYAAKFAQIAEQVQDLGKEGNAKAAEVITEYNLKVDAVRDELLGQKVEFDVLEETEGTDETAAN